MPLVVPSAGDPLLSFLKDAWARSQGRAPPPVLVDVPEDSEAVFWLREQFEGGALPRDPALVRSLLEQGRRDPQLVKRLVAEAKDGSGRSAPQRAAARGSVDADAAPAGVCAEPVETPEV